MKQHYFYYVFLPTLLFLGLLGFVNKAVTYQPAADISRPADSSDIPAQPIQEPQNHSSKVRVG